MVKSTAVVRERPREIVHRTHGRRQGPITRLMSPSDLGQTLKPFVFLDLFDTERGSFSGVGWHPHSGIATLTYLWEGSVRYEDTTGAAGLLPAGGSNGSRPLAAPGMAAVPATPAGPADSNSGLPCHPTKSSGRAKASTKSRRTFTQRDPPPSCLAPSARCRAR